MAGSEATAGNEPRDGPPAARSKQAFRNEAKERRSGLSPAERAARSAEICRRIARSGLLDAARAVMVYAAFRGEVDVAPLAEALLKRGCVVAFPRVDARSKAMAPVAVASLGQLVPGAFGIPEPPASERRLEPGELDAIVVPALAYDREGYRLGYGGGYYDRFLPLVPKTALRLGAVYHDLLYPRLPREPFDQRVDWVITERETLGPFRK